MPVGDAPHREIEMDPGRETRFELALLAIAGDEHLSVSRLEIERPGPSYTVETLRALRSEAPEDELFLIIGGDQALELPNWHEPEEILTLATIAVAEREEASREQVTAAVGLLGGAAEITFFTMPRVDISSSMVRTRVGVGAPLRYLVPEAVAEYIARKGLYSGVKESA
jgi:nicotinate-nucleotide adenylyltransferase